MPAGAVALNRYERCCVFLWSQMIASGADKTELFAFVIEKHSPAMPEAKVLLKGASRR